MGVDFGIYVHVPYCRVQCPYCTFFTVEKPIGPPAARFLAALTVEWRLRVVPRLERGDRARTLYVGGGTPSDLSRGEFGAFLAAISADLPDGLAALDEVTVECNPESATADWLDGLAAAGVGRVSLGVQALDDRDLRTLGRGGNAADARRALADVASRFATWSADLIIGIPASDDERLARAVDEIAGAGSPHVSFYCLEMPPERARRLGDPQTEASETRKAEWYEATSARLVARGYEHYEISSAARPGHRARHNSSYWDGTDYVGLGAGAHSFEAGVRSANVPDLDRWWTALERGELPPVTRERLSATMRRDERLLCGLRRLEGVPRAWLTGCDGLVTQLESAGLARAGSDRLGLTPAGFLVSDSIVLQLVAALGPVPEPIDNEITPSLDLRV